MEPERSKPNHNISMLGLKLRNQRVMRCANVTTLTTNNSQQSLSAFNQQQQAYDRSQDFQKLMTDLKVSTSKLKVYSFEKARPTVPWNLRIERAPYNLRHHAKLVNSPIEIVEPRNKKREEEISERLKFFVSHSKGDADQDFLAMIGSKPPKKPKLWPKSMHWLLDVSNNTMTTPTTDPSQQQSLFACNEQQQQAYERPQGYQELMTDLKVSSGKLKFPVFDEGRPTRTCNLMIEREPFNFKHHPKSANSVVGVMLSRNKTEGKEEEKINLRKNIIEKLKFSNSFSKEEGDQYFLAFFGSKPPIKPKLCPKSIHWKLDVSNNTMTTPIIDLSRQKYMFAFSKQQQSYDQAQGYRKLMTDPKVSTRKLKDSIFNKGKPTRPLNLRTEKAPWNCKRHTKPNNSISGIMVPANKKDEEEEKFLERLKYSISPKDEVEQDFLARVGNKSPKKSNK